MSLNNKSIFIASLLTILTNTQADTLNTISVIATRDEAKTIDIPASIGVISKESLALDKPNYQKELLNSIAGVRITQTGSTIGHMTSIRMPNNTGAYYLFLQDGIPVQSSGFFNHNGLAYTNFTSAGSTEVLKGAGTALYGSDAVAGVVNVISNEPSTKGGYKLKINTGSDNFYKLGVSSSNQYDEDSNLSFDVSSSNSQGWRDHTNSKRKEINITHHTTLDENNALKTIFSANSSNAEMAGSLIGLDALNNNPGYAGDVENAINSGQDIRRKFDFARISTELTHFVNDEIELSTIAYLRSNRNRYVATWEKNLPQNDSKEKTLGLMFKANIENNNTLWMLGTDLEMTKSNRNYNQSVGYDKNNDGDFLDNGDVVAGDIYDYNVDYLAISPYVRAEHDLSDKFKLSAGLRYDVNKFDYTNNLADGRYAASYYSRPSDNNDPTFNHLSPKLSLSYKIDNNQNTYVRFANGFRIPQASRLYSLKTKNINFTLDPETTNTLEFGYKLATSKHQFDASIYYMSIDDSIVRRKNGSDEYYVNGGKTIHKGVELSWFNKINQQFSTRIAYSHSKHNYDNDKDYGNNEQAKAPNNTLNLRLNYQPNQKLSTMFEVEHIDEYYLDDDNTREYDGYTIANLKANYQIDDGLKLSAKINNITNKIYAENASLSYGKEKYTPGAPRQFFLGVEYDF